MPRLPNAVYIGIRGYALALDRTSGHQLWRTALKGHDFVNIVVENDELYAAARGEVWRLDPVTGTVVWHNQLKGLGFGLVSIAGGGAALAAEKRRRDAAQAVAAAS